MCHFLAPTGQPEMMHKNFMLMPLCIFVVQRSCMKFYANFSERMHSMAAGRIKGMTGGRTA